MYPNAVLCNRRAFLPLILLVCASVVQADSSLDAPLKRPILAPGTTQAETLRLAQTKLLPFPESKTIAEWEVHATRIRADVLDKVVLRGVPAEWTAGPVQVEMLDEIPCGPGYKMRKLRYQMLPGFWIPAILYLPEKIEGKVPVFLNVNGHDPKGKQAPYKQMRCINQAKRGIIVLNVEWLQMGQLKHDDNAHGRLNQLDLCGVSGLAPFYLSMKRGLDLLLSLEHADPTRVGVAGLSGGGWQTIFIASLDTRVTLANPVAGYSGLATRLEVFPDLGDSEQAPCDMSLYADYTHLTALLAPRSALLTYNSKDECCFKSATALPPLLAAAQPIYQLYGVPQNLTSHVNEDPGTHNFLVENREALYARIGQAFFPDVKDYSAKEIPCEAEVKSADDLLVPLPENNATLHSLAVALVAQLPLNKEIPADSAALSSWQEERRAVLRDLVRYRDYPVESEAVAVEQHGETRLVQWKLKLGEAWTVPLLEFSRATPRGTVVLFSDRGRSELAEFVEAQLGQGKRVVVPDLWYGGECHPVERDYLFGLLLSTVGERPVGVQASQLAAVAKWCVQSIADEPVTVQAHGERATLPAVIAAGLEASSIQRTELYRAQTSLKQVIDQNQSFEKTPEQFCFGLLREFDLPQLEALAPVGSVIRN
ncbi:MAG: hypothetical protein WD851_21995 [Pirellulales bacterium]